MGVTLITGVGGFIGGALLEELGKDNDDVLGLSRTQKSSWNIVRADFASYEDLKALDRWGIDRLCHLGAATGGCSEHEGLSVNVAGTRTLLRYIVDRGCRKVVLASSIAAVGLADADFVPKTVPIDEEHPCLARDPYGASKYLMERIGEYFSRVDSRLEVTALRLASIFPDVSPPPKCNTGSSRGSYALAKLTQMCLSDAVQAFKTTLEAELGPGFRVLNATPLKAWSAVPTRVVLDNWFDGVIETSWFASREHEYDAVFSCERMREMVEFSPCC